MLMIIAHHYVVCAIIDYMQIVLIEQPLFRKIGKIVYEV